MDSYQKKSPYPIFKLWCWSLNQPQHFIPSIHDIMFHMCNNFNVGQTDSLPEWPRIEKSDNEPNPPKSVRFGDVNTSNPDLSASKWNIVRLRRKNFHKLLPINRIIIREGYSAIYSLITFNFTSLNLSCYPHNMLYQHKIRSEYHCHINGSVWTLPWPKLRPR